MVNGVMHFIKANRNIWGRRLTEAAAVCFMLGGCLSVSQSGGRQMEAARPDDAETGVASAAASEEENGREQKNEEEESEFESMQYDLGDMDGNGQSEYVEVTSETGGMLSPSHLYFYFNGELIYEYEDSLRIVDVEDAEYLDLDQDGEEEIFFSFLPSVNSAPLTEYAVLKRTGGGWKALEMIHGEDMLDNAFPISCRRGKEENTAVIACEGMEKQIVYTMYDENSEDGAEEGVSGESLQDYREGDECGRVYPWGIWEIKSGDFEGRNCLIATHGLERLSEEWGCIDMVYIYFDYNEKGLVNILDMKFKPWDSQEIIGTAAAKDRIRRIRFSMNNPDRFDKQSYPLKILHTM